MVWLYTITRETRKISGTARHLTDPAGKVVTATMEEGIYEIDSKSLAVTADKPVTLIAEIDLTGEGHWATYAVFGVKPGAETTHSFPPEFQAYWIRFKASAPCTASAQLEYR